MRNFNRKPQEPRRKELRNNATFAERILWYSLRGAQLDGRKFRRQHGIGPFIVDFYCPEERLAIELDGDIHGREDIRSYDEERQQKLEQLGIRVLRFSNELVLNQSDAALETIRATWKGRERSPVTINPLRWRAARQSRSHPENTTPQPPPLSEEGE